LGVSNPQQTCPGSRDPACNEVVNVHTFSDASSTLGIGIVIRDKWRAWTLKPRWYFDGRDITWAEAVSMELLVRAILREARKGARFKIYRDNRGVITGLVVRSKSKPPSKRGFSKTNHSLLSLHGCEVYTKLCP